ncbi:hypothetical protein PGT21_024092 [Puccinia graminis f. sp. tritici]|uniref:GH18 domain-containing protein n=1 Tax=Puccinia graminis f. sp. tritici TaxID=56615 RepID=A0A5B0M112_PUCGR|nr:hypothetical protein PGT21_024092 [Puccinia graminis f. sp. tritici]
MANRLITTKTTLPLPLPVANLTTSQAKTFVVTLKTGAGSFLVNELISNGWLTPDQKHGANGYQRYYDSCSGQPFLTNGKYFITYDDQFSTVDKAKFAKQNGLGGIYFFDTMGPTAATVRAARQALSIKPPYPPPNDHVELHLMSLVYL